MRCTGLKQPAELACGGLDQAGELGDLADQPARDAGDQLIPRRDRRQVLDVCRIDDLANEDLTSVSYVGTWTRLSSWFPWMLMGQAEGHLYFRCYISKFNDLESLPATFLAKAEKEHAAYLEPPSFDSWGQRNDSTFNMWKKLRKPVPVNG